MNLSIVYFTEIWIQGSMCNGVQMYGNNVQWLNTVLIFQPSSRTNWEGHIILIEICCEMVMPSY